MLKVQAVLFLLDVANLGGVDCNCDAAKNRSLSTCAEICFRRKALRNSGYHLHISH